MERSINKIDQFQRYLLQIWELAHVVAVGVIVIVVVNQLENITKIFGC